MLCPNRKNIFPIFSSIRHLVKSRNLITSSENLQARTVNFYQEFTFPSVFETFLMKFHPERKRGVQFHQKSRENTRESKFQVKYSSPEGNSRHVNM